jgi:flavin reductase (DIM6/NTAB) family NADH-FMN oxidoreductase RutF
MEILAADLQAEAAYKLLTGIIVPRPIAWVTTLSPNGRVNAAPFSAFTFVSSHPPMVGINIGRRAGAYKDTARYIMERQEFVVNIADESLLEPLHFSAVEHPPEISETEHLGLEVCPSKLIATPRIAAAPISLECRVERILEFGTAKSQFIVGEIVMFHVRDSLYRSGKIETSELKPVCRLGGPNYAKLGEIVRMKPIGASPESAGGINRS